tara:strand:- start:35734 stop:37536 length:1803 start_codon:yes stop_codon:yes gene_type:complete
MSVFNLIVSLCKILRSLSFLSVIFLSMVFSGNAQTPSGFNLVAYEGFDYTSGSSLLNANGGSGWTTDWVGTYQDRYLKTATTGFTYTGLSTEGLKAEFDNTCYGSCNQIAALKRSLPLQSSGVVYFQFISVFESPGGAGTPHIRLYNGADFVGIIGANTGAFMSIVEVAGVTQTQSSASLAAQNLVVVRIDYDLNTTDMWVNPDLSTFDYSNPTSPSASDSGFSPSFDSIQIYIRSGSIDEVTVFSQKPAPTITNFNNITKTYFDASYTIAAPTSNSTGAFTYTSNNPAVATISGTTVTITGTGTATITAAQAGDDTYASGDVSATLAVNSYSIVTENGQFSRANVNYVNKYGAIGEGFGVTKNGLPIQTKSDDIITTGLVMYLDAGNEHSYTETGTTWMDLSGNDNHGTLQNGVIYNSANNGSLVFDGVDDYFVTDTGLDLSDTDKITIQIIIKYSSTPVSMILEHSTDWNSNNAFGVLGGQPSGKMQFTDHNQDYNASHSTNTLNDNNWHFFSVTVDRSQVANNQSIIYVDGVLNHTQTSLNADTSGNYSSLPLYIGARAGSNYFFNGNIAQVLIYKRVLTAVEVQQNFNAVKLKYGL